MRELTYATARRLGTEASFTPIRSADGVGNGIDGGLGRVVGLLHCGLGFALGGFGVVPVRVHVGLGLVIGLFVVGGTVARPGWLECRAGLEAGDPETASRGARRLIGAMYVEQVSWLIVLPEGASMTLRGQAPFSLDTLREVRP